MSKEICNFKIKITDIYTENIGAGDGGDKVWNSYDEMNNIIISHI